MPQATQGTSEQALNQINLQMRQQPWYQEWFQARGLDPNQVRLNDAQRRDLEATAAQNGFSLGGRMKIDEAGNINQQGGWAGMHPAAKLAIGGGVTAASLGLIPGVPGLGSIFGGGGSGVGAGTGSGLNAAASGAAFNSGPLMMGSGELMGAAGAGAIPTIASRQIGNGMGADPASLAGTGAVFGANAGSNALGRFASQAGEAAAGGMSDKLLGAAIAALAGITGGMNRGPSDEERALQSQTQRLLGQQEQRTQFQNPLYEATTRMAYGLLPNMGNNGQPYPIGSLNDVKVPSLEDLIAQQRRS